jgi:hypothetical protein
MWALQRRMRGSIDEWVERRREVDRRLVEGKRDSEGGSRR